MKKGMNFITRNLAFASVLLLVVLYSCSNAELDYNQKKWKHKERMLDVEYKKELIELKSKAELRLLIEELDSMRLHCH